MNSLIYLSGITEELKLNNYRPINILPAVSTIYERSQITTQINIYHPIFVDIEKDLRHSMH